MISFNKALLSTALLATSGMVVAQQADKADYPAWAEAAAAGGYDWEPYQV